MSKREELIEILDQFWTPEAQADALLERFPELAFECKGAVLHLQNSEYDKIIVHRSHQWHPDTNECVYCGRAREEKNDHKKV